MAVNEMEGQDRIRRVLVLMLSYAVILTCLFFIIGAQAARADGVISWTGQGAEQTPCPGGAHWILAPSFGIDSATLQVDDLGSFAMEQNGNGSWSVDTPGEIDANTGAGVSYTGPGDERDHLQLSHCLPGPSPSPSPLPSPSGGPTTPPSPCTTTPPAVVTHVVTRTVRVFVPVHSVARPVAHVQHHVVSTTG